jgi:hypothetical protein
MENHNSTPLTNGDKPSSKVLSHLQSYPVIQDSLELYKTNPYGAKSLSVANTIYNKFVSPFQPYLQTPYSYLSPYIERADDLGDTGLSKVDTTFPIVKEDTNKLKETVQSYAFLPLTLAGQGKQYVLGTFNDEYSKTRGDGGLVKLAKAAISTELKIGHDGFNLVVGYLNKRKQETSKKVNEVKQ